jgi:hypothetical protein
MDLVSPNKDWLDIILAIVQIFTLIVLVIYVKKTWDMAVSTEDSANVSKLTLQEMKDTRDQENSPYIVAYFEFSEYEIYLVIENVGKGLANNIKIEFDPELNNSIRGIKINEIPLIKEGIGSMPPNYKIKTFFDGTVKYFNGDFPCKYNATITYYGGINETKRTSKHILDIRSYYKVMFSHETNLKDVVDELKKISNSLKK